MIASTVFSSPFPQLQSRIQDRTAQVGIVGLGYVGLPLAVEFARAGFCVTDIDVSDTKDSRGQCR